MVGRHSDVAAGLAYLVGTSGTTEDSVVLES